MTLPAHIESELRAYAKEMGWSEVELIHYKESLLKLVTIAIEESKRKIKQAA